MKQLIVFSMIGLVIFLGLGCFKVDSEITVNPDGSGTIKTTMGINKQMIGMMGGMMQQHMAQEESEDEDNPKKESPDMVDTMEAQMKKEAEKAVAQMGEGVELKSFKKEIQGEQISFISEYVFKDVNKINFKFGNNQTSGSGNTYKFMFKKLSTGEAELIIQSPIAAAAQKRINESQKIEKQPKQASKEEAGKDEDEGTDNGDDNTNTESQMAMAKTMFKDMAMRVSIICGSQIIKTDATSVNGNRIALMEMDFGKLIANEQKFNGFLKKGQAQSPQNPEEAMPLLAEFFNGTDGFKMELKEEVKVQFK
jgi:hypothetical protein